MKKKSTADKSKDKSNQIKQDEGLELLLRHEKFIEEYLSCFNGVLAYQLAYPDAEYDTARVNASRLLTNANIKRELEKRFAARMITKKEVLDRLLAQANASLLPFVKIDDEGHIYFNFKDPEAKRNFHLIKKVKHKKTITIHGDGKEIEHWVEVDLHDPQKALELIGKYYALFTEKVQQTEKKIIHVTFKKEE